MDGASPQLPVPPPHECLQYVAGMYTCTHTGGFMQKPVVGIRYLYHSLPLPETGLNLELANSARLPEQASGILFPFLARGLQVCVALAFYVGARD